MLIISRHYYYGHHINTTTQRGSAAASVALVPIRICNMLRRVLRVLSDVLQEAKRLKRGKVATFHWATIPQEICLEALIA
jgi:hypothetical protein